jgi:hypothetical protein
MRLFLKKDEGAALQLVEKNIIFGLDCGGWSRRSLGVEQPGNRSRPSVPRQGA